MKGLEAKGVSFFYRKKRPLIENLSLTFPRRGLYLAEGPSGSGKSTLFSLLLGFLSPREGSIEIGGRSVVALRKEGKLNAYFAYLGPCSHYPGSFSFRKLAETFLAADEREKANSLLALFGLEDKAERKLSALSGGEKKAALLSLILAAKSPYLLLDEPFSSLDGRRKGILSLLLKKEREERFVLLINHDREVNLGPDERLVFPLAPSLAHGPSQADEIAPRASFSPSFKVSAGLSFKTLRAPSILAFCLFLATFLSFVFAFQSSEVLNAKAIRRTGMAMSGAAAFGLVAGGIVDEESYAAVPDEVLMEGYFSSGKTVAAFVLDGLAEEGIFLLPGSKAEGNFYLEGTELNLAAAPSFPSFPELGSFLDSGGAGVVVSRSYFLSNAPSIISTLSYGENGPSARLFPSFALEREPGGSSYAWKTVRSAEDGLPVDPGLKEGVSLSFLPEGEGEAFFVEEPIAYSNDGGDRGLSLSYYRKLSFIFGGSYLSSLLSGFSYLPYLPFEEALAASGDALALADVYLPSLTAGLSATFFLGGGVIGLVSLLVYFLSGLSFPEKGHRLRVLLSLNGVSERSAVLASLLPAFLSLLLPLLLSYLAGAAVYFPILSSLALQGGYRPSFPFFLPQGAVYPSPAYPFFAFSPWSFLLLPFAFLLSLAPLIPSKKGE